MLLTNRQKMLMRAALSYALSNLDDVNDAFDHDGEGKVKVGDDVGDSFSEDEVEALRKQFGPAPAFTGDLRAFRGTFLVAISDSEAVESENREEGNPVTLAELTDYLDDALRVDIDTEEYGNPVGFQSAEVQIDTLEELPPEEVARLYSK